MRSFLVVVLCLSSRIGLGYCEKPTFQVVFANGMFNSKIAARRSFQKLRSSLNLPAGIDLNSSIENIAYNTDENILSQLFEVARQKSADANESFWRYLSHFSESPDWFKELAAQVEKTIVWDEVTKNKDLQIQIGFYQKILGRKENHVLTIAHSQGNFFTNFAFAHIENRQLDTRRRLNMVSVATSASFVFGHGPYVTLKSDCVIAPIPGALKANTVNESAGICDHEFVKNYLGGAESLKRIEKAISDAILLTDDLDVPLALDIKDFLNWMERFKTADFSEKLEPHQCYAIRLSQSLKNLYWQNITCERRGLSGLKEASSQCLAAKNKNKKKLAENLCPTFFGKESNAVSDMIGGLFEESKMDRAFAKHEECNWESETFMQNVLSEELSTKALKFIEEPWAEIDLK